MEVLISILSRQYQIKKQVIGENPDLEKSGIRLNRVIAWNRDGITIGADQRPVRERSKNLELERANRSATPCAVERNTEGNARRDGSKGENRCEQEQTQTKHERVGMGDGDGRNRPLMAGDDANDSQALTGGDITKYRALVARTSYLSQDRPDLKFASMQVCCAMAKPSGRDMERVKRIGSYLAGKPRAKCRFRWQQSGELESCSDADGEATKPLDDWCQLESHHERRTQPCGVDQGSSEWCHCPQPRVSGTPQTKPHQKGWGSRAWQTTWAKHVG